MKIHFEIGHQKELDPKWGTCETESVFRSELLSECIKEWNEKGYTEPEYFIDVWETDSTGCPFPLADLKLDACTLDLAFFK